MLVKSIEVVVVVKPKQQNRLVFLCGASKSAAFVSTLFAVLVVLGLDSQHIYKYIYIAPSATLPPASADGTMMSPVQW